jgi:hypothetical protein
MDIIGLDLHKRESRMAITPEDGTIAERRIVTSRERFPAVLGSRPRARCLRDERLSSGAMCGSSSPCASSWVPPRIAAADPIGARLCRDSCRPRTADACTAGTGCVGRVLRRGEQDPEAPPA